METLTYFLEGLFSAASGMNLLCCRGSSPIKSFQS